MKPKKFQKFLDDATPYTAYRWGFTAFICLVYFLRVLLVQGWYIVTVGSQSLVTPAGGAQMLVASHSNVSGLMRHLVLEPT